MPDPLYWRRKSVLLKMETEYSSDSTPTGGANALEFVDFSISPFESTEVQRPLVRPYMGATKIKHTALHARTSFAIEVAGSGAAGTPPAWGPVLRACAMAETITTDTNVKYAPVSDSFESASVYVNVSGVLHKLLGFRGSWRLQERAEQIPLIYADGMALWAQPADDTLPDIDVSAFLEPLEANDANSSFSLHGYSAALESLDLRYNADVQHISRVGSERIDVNDHPADGEALFEAPPLATKNFFAIAAAHTLGALQFVHGTSAGNIVTFDAPAAQIRAPAYADSKGTTMLRTPLALIPDEGDDELTVTVT